MKLFREKYIDEVYKDNIRVGLEYLDSFQFPVLIFGSTGRRLTAAFFKEKYGIKGLHVPPIRKADYLDKGRWGGICQI